MNYQSAPLISHADELARSIRNAPAQDRLRLQPDLGRLLQEMEQAGTNVPARLRNLHEQLLEEAIEAQFDNLPV
jgi:hypothetical protein